MSRLGDLLRKTRDEHGWTLRNVQEATGISNGYLSLIEKGKVKAPSPAYLESLAGHYGLVYEHLMELAGYPAPRGGAAESTRPKGLSDGAQLRDWYSDGEPVVAQRSPSMSGTGGIDGIFAATPSRQSGGLNADVQRIAGAIAAKTSRDQPAGVGLEASEVQGLTPEELGKVRAFIAGLRASHRS